MSTTIQIKRSSTASGVPLSTDLAVGELAVNLADKRLFTKQSDGTIIELSTNPTDLDAATLRIDGVEITASATELNSLDGFTGSTAELNLLDGLTATTIELNTLDGITASTAELNKLDGYTGSTAELNILDGVTSTTAEINKLDGFTGTVDDLNYAKDLRATGVTTAELDVLDGITATTTELNYTDGVTSNIQTQLDAMVEKAGDTMTGDLSLGDNVKAKFGAGNDLQIYHDGVSSYIKDSGSGNLNLTTNGTGIWMMNDAGTETMAKFIQNGAVTIYHNNAEKLATTSTGVEVTGDVSLGDNGKVKLGASDDLQIYHNGSNSFITDEGTGSLYIRGSSQVRVETPTGENMAIFNDNGGVSLRYDNSKKFETTSTGIDVTGTVTADGLAVGVTPKTGGSTWQHIQFGGTGNLIARFSDTTPDAMFASNYYINSSGTDSRIVTGESARMFLNNDEFIFDRASSGAADSAVAWARSMTLGSNGDVSFYEDTGTTAKMVWDASAESLNVGGNINYGYGINVGDSGYGINSTGVAQIVMRGTEYRLQGVNPSPMTFYTANSERMRIDSSGNVGIGTSSPSAKLDVVGAIDAESINVVKNQTSDTAIEVANVGSASATTTSSFIVSETAGQPKGWFRRYRDGSARTSIGYETNFTIEDTAGSEKARLDSSGNLLVGTTAFPTDDNNAMRFGVSGSSGQTRINVNNDSALHLKRATSDGDMLVFRRDSATPVGSIGSYSGGSGNLDVSSGGTTTKLRLQDMVEFIDSRWSPTEQVTPTRSGVDLGSSGLNWDNLYLSGGVYLGGTGSVNKLDDYEEGTWSPTLSTTTGSFSLNGSYNLASYTKVGRLVTVTARLDVSAISSPNGNIVITNLPFTSSNLGDAAGFSVQFGFITIGANQIGNPVAIEIGEGSTLATIRTLTWSGAANELAVNSRIQFSLTYITSS